MHCSEGYQESIGGHLSMPMPMPMPMPRDIREEVNQFTEMNNPKFPR
jgi:hypothetical protein